MSKIIKWDLRPCPMAGLKSITDLYKFVIAPYDCNSREHLFCICYARSEVRVFENCIKKENDRTNFNQPKYVLKLNDVKITDKVDQQIINAFKKCRLFDLDFGPKINNQYYVIFDDVPHQYIFPEKNTFIKSLKILLE